VAQARCRSLQTFVREQFGLTAEQIASLEAGVEELKEASRRVGRKDWRLIFYGLFVTMAANDLMPVATVQTIFTVVGHGLAHLFGIGGPPPALPPQT
jgi:hypothetical protein